MSTFKKITKVLSIAFLSLIIISIGIANYNHFTATPEEKAQFKIDNQESDEIKAKKRAEKQANDLEKRKAALEKQRLKALENEAKQIAREEERQAELAKKEKERIDKAKQDFLKKIPEYERLAGVCSRTYVEAMIAPRPADFPIKPATYEEERNLYRISSYVDTVNDFNAPMRQRYYCEISGIDLDTFTCQKHDCQWE